MASERWHPGKLLEMSGYYWRTCTLHAAVKLDIFSILDQGSLTAGQVAEALNADADAVERLLNALAAMQLVHKREGLFSNTETAAAHLVKASDQYIGYMIMHHHHLMESWNRMDEAVRTGRPVRSRSSFNDPSVRESFLMGMFNNAMLMAPRLVKSLDLTGRCHLLDLGGGPGTYAIHFCLQYPRLKATIFDLPTTRIFAEETIARFEMQDRIAFVAGDFVKETIPGDYDVVWMSHILHAEGPATCQAMIRKAHGVLAPDGQIIIHDFMLNDDGCSPQFPALFSLNMLLGTPQGRSYTERQIKQMLADAGFRQIVRSDFTGPTESSLMMAVK